MDLIGVALMMVGVAGLIRSLLPPPAGPGRRDDDRSDRRALQAWKR